MPTMTGDHIPRYEQPMDPPEKTPDEWMGSCAHSAACERMWRIFVGPLSRRSDDEMARTFGCGECTAFDY